MDTNHEKDKSSPSTSLLIFNLETGMDSQVLAASHDWVEEFSRHYSRITVISTHVGRIALPDHVNVIELGGGTFRTRVRATLRLARQIPFLILNRKQLSVFHHMATYPAALLSPLIRLLGIKQSIWYSHSHPSLSFKWSSKFVNHIYGPALGAVPLKSQKIRFLGHGIKVESFSEWKSSENLYRSGLVSIGRIAPIKNFHLLLSEEFPSRLSRVDLVGPSSKEKNYDLILRNLASEFGVNLSIQPPVPYFEIAKILRSYSFFFSGTPKSVDKAAVEAALSGCFIISSNRNLLEITGMLEVWKAINQPIPNSIFEQINHLWSYQNHLNLHRLVSDEAAKKNNLKKLVEEIIHDFH